MLFIRFVVFCKKHFLKDRRFPLCSENDLNLDSTPCKVIVFFSEQNTSIPTD